jgi:hypothetical protein
MKCYDAYDWGPVYDERGDVRTRDPLLVNVLVYDNLDGTYDVTLNDVGPSDDQPWDGLYRIGAENYADAARAGATWFDLDLLT